MDKLSIGIFTPNNSWMFPYSQKLYQELLPYSSTLILESELQSQHSGDIAFYLSYPKIISPIQLKQYTHNIVVHASSLPHGKGWSPTSWQILEEKNIIPITLFEATEKVDNGTIYLQDTLILNGDELIDSWRNKLAQMILSLCNKFIQNYPQILQQGRLPSGDESYYPKRTPAHSELSIHKTIKEQFNLLRIVDNENYPAFFVINNKKYLIKIYEESK